MQATADSVEKWRQDNPSLKDTKITTDTPSPTLVNSQSKPETKNTPIDQAAEPDKPAPDVKIPEISPALSSMSQLDLSKTQLTAYAEQMLKSNKPQLARLAYERIIDSAKDANENDRRLAASAIYKLSSKTPLWNPDPSTRKKIILRLNIDQKYIPSLKPEIEQLQKMIFNASDGTVTASAKITPSSTPLSELSIGNHPPVRFSVKNQEEVTTKIHQALYYALRNRNNETQKLISIPSLPKDITPEQALRTYITRIAWMNAAN